LPATRLSYYPGVFQIIAFAHSAGMNRSVEKATFRWLSASLRDYLKRQFEIHPIIRGFEDKEKKMYYFCLQNKIAAA
jgi:hypothetical protein